MKLLNERFSDHAKVNKGHSKQKFPLLIVNAHDNQKLWQFVRTCTKINCVAEVIEFTNSIYTMPSKIQPIRMQESRCILDDIAPNLLIVRCAYVALIVLATIFYDMVKTRVY